MIVSILVFFNENTIANKFNICVPLIFFYFNHVLIRIHIHNFRKRLDAARIICDCILKLKKKQYLVFFRKYTIKVLVTVDCGR